MVAADDLTAVVLAGGAGRRLGGPGKPGLLVGGRTLLDHVLAACPSGCGLVVVGPERPTERAVRWAREEPPGGGPLAGIAAGLGLVTTPLVLLLAADLPAVSDAVPPLLAAARAAVANGRDGAWAVDDEGRPQPLVSCVSAVAVRGELPEHPAGLPVITVLGRLRLDPVGVRPGAVDDVDTPGDLARVREDGEAWPSRDDEETR